MKSSLQGWLFLLVAICFSWLMLSSVSGQEVKEADGVGVVQAEKNPVARMRGRLLYKRGQIRKLEKAAAESNEALRNKVDELEKERRAQYVAAEPKLVELYAEQDALEEEVKRMTESEKNK